VLKEGSPWDPGYIDAYVERLQDCPGQRIDRLRQHLLTEKRAEEFTSAEALARQVEEAVARLLQAKARGEAGEGSLPAASWQINSVASPYPGLQPFTRRFSPVFCGREREV
jgi:hypothetical protein